MKSSNTYETDGFSLLELLIVVAIVLIIATIAVPALLRTRQSANESAAVANLRTISTAEATYILSSSGNYGSLPELITAGLMDSRFTGSVSGYLYDLTTYVGGFSAAATPSGLNAGRFGYALYTDSVIRYATNISSVCNPCYPAGLSGEPIH
jgi:prepilin-type N-terminal cleavage/methylation domain-containing protein